MTPEFGSLDPASSTRYTDRNDFWQHGQFSAGDRREKEKERNRSPLFSHPLALLSAMHEGTRSRAFAFVLRATCLFFFLFFLRALRKRSLPFGDGESCVHRVSFLPLISPPFLPSVPRICVHARPARCTFVKVLALNMFSESRYIRLTEYSGRSSFPDDPPLCTSIARERNVNLSWNAPFASYHCAFFNLGEPLSHFLLWQCKYSALFAIVRISDAWTFVVWRKAAIVMEIPASGFFQPQSRLAVFPARFLITRIAPGKCQSFG